jgi:hypothetical protein
MREGTPLAEEPSAVTEEPQGGRNPEGGRAATPRVAAEESPEGAKVMRGALASGG